MFLKNRFDLLVSWSLLKPYKKQEGRTQGKGFGGGNPSLFEAKAMLLTVGIVLTAIK